MNENEKAKQDEFREVWIESLLVSAANPQEHTDRVARAMEQIGKAVEQQASEIVGPELYVHLFVSHNFRTPLCYFSIHFLSNY